MKHAALALVLVAVVACGPSSSGSAHRVGEVTLSVTGGIAGWDRELVIDESGTARLTVTRGPSPARTSYTVPAETLQRLRGALGDPAFARLDAEYPAPSGAADLQTYVIAAEIDGNRVEKTTHDAAAAPQVLQDVLAILLQVLDAFSSSAAAGLNAGCSSGYSPTAPTVRVGVADDQTLRTVTLCSSIFVLLESPANGSLWQTPTSSDPGVLEIVPLPLPHAPGGGVEAVFLARHVGAAHLDTGSVDPACPSGAFCPALPVWFMTVNVV